MSPVFRGDVALERHSCFSVQFLVTLNACIPASNLGDPLVPADVFSSEPLSVLLVVPTNVDVELSGLPKYRRLSTALYVGEPCERRRGRERAATVRQHKTA